MFQGAADSGAVDVQGDLGFSTYSTFAGKIDWKFTHKNHFYLAGSPFNQSRETVLNRQITFQGQTFLAGSTIRASLDSNLVTPRATSTTLSAGSAATLESAYKSTYLIPRQRSARRLRSEAASRNRQYRRGGPFWPRFRWRVPNSGCT